MENGLEACQRGCGGPLKRLLWSWEESWWFGLGWGTEDAESCRESKAAEDMQLERNPWRSGHGS